MGMTVVWRVSSSKYTSRLLREHPADVLSTDGNRTTTSCLARATVQSRCGMRRHASVYAPSLDTTRLCVPFPWTLLLDVLSVQAMIKASSYLTYTLGPQCI